jgi:hypothetical protein
MISRPGGGPFQAKAAVDFTARRPWISRKAAGCFTEGGDAG